MPRYEVMQRRKAQQDLKRRWELPAGTRVWCYLRHSPGDNQTIDSQEAGMREWCAENGWPIDRMFVDEAIEGSREDRAQFQLMMSLARQEPRPVDGIVLWAFSRFARNQLDAQFYKADLRKRGYVILSKVDDIPGNEMAPIYEAFIDWKNQRFLDDLSADVKRGQNFLVKQGFWPGGTPPVGFTTVGEVIGQRRTGEPRMGHKLVKDAAVADHVALAWRMKLEENASYERIHEATHLYGNRQHYAHFFSNLLYAGIFRYHGKRFPTSWEQGETFCEPYVTLDEYMRVQANRQQRVIIRDGHSPRVLASPVLLSGLVVCGNCLAKGRRVTVTARVDKRRQNTSWYICGVKLRQRGADCDLPRVACWLLEDTIIQSLVSMVLTPEYVMREVAHAQELLDELQPHLEAEITRLEEEAAQKESSVRELLRLIQRQGLSPVLEDEYEHANHAWTAVTNQVTQVRADLKRCTPTQLTEAEIHAYVQDVQRILQEGEIQTRQELLRRFVKSIILYPNHAEVEYTFGLSTLTPLGGFGGYDSPLEGAPRATRTPAPGSGGRCSIR
jgi:site-specific DNA recombinase